MREIKFRAWNKEKSIMVYEDEDNSSAYWDGVCLSDIEMINARLKYSSTYIWMQYTGLKDRNGREIYEGDILQISNKENKDYHMEVLWTGQGFGYTIIRNETKRSGYIVGHHSERGLNFYNGASEVIGNIYEDPELLEASHASK
ncbi:hypothetical protein NRS6084_03906 [Bacillus subtilis]|nr:MULTISPECIES: YopX family protein [Bacillus]CAF1772701.1 hypothetical protein NRS6084_03906 [Bacillus subtilis]